MSEALPDGASAPSESELMGARSDGAARAAWWAARRAFVRLDRSGLAAAGAALHAMAPGSAPDRLAAALRGVLDAAALGVDLARVEADAAEAGDAALVVDAASIRALASLEDGDLDGARRHARRAVRMARTEELPAAQYLAGIVLARLRRYAHQPHLALRILGALRAVVPPTYRDWVAWELALAGDESTGPSDASGLGEATRALGGWLARSPAERVREVGRASAAMGLARFVARDLDALASLLDPDCTPHAMVRDWAYGALDPLPRGLDGLAHDREDGWLALVTVDPSRPARRVLATGAVPEAHPRIHSSRPGRLETAISVLALAPNGMEAVAFFEAVYRFAYEHEIHKGPLEVLVHRARELLGQHAEVVRDGPMIALRARGPFAVPDPRAPRSIDDAVLSSLARGAAGSARDAARELGVPLRNVQHALKRLVEEGACEVEKHGREVRYRVEDTTFSEPTQALRFRAEP
ncbi:MAG: hypothetical protein AB7S26_34300 [Sandaracinaceae bacterium]